MTQADVLRVAIALVLIVAALLVAAWLAKRSGLLPRQGGNVLRLVASLPVGTRQSIAVVQVRDTWVVVGVTPSGMTPLHTLPAEPAADADADSQTLPAAAVPAPHAPRSPHSPHQRQAGTFAAALAKRLADVLDKRP